MPYEKLTDLPDNVRDNLPKHAQEIYRAAFNSAEEQYDEEDRRHRVAWAAVKDKYEKDEDSGEWVERVGQYLGVDAFYLFFKKITGR